MMVAHSPKHILVPALAVSLLVACSSDEPKKPSASTVADAGLAPPSGTASTTSTTSMASTTSAPLSAATTDAGAPPAADAGFLLDAGTGATPARAAAPATAFDRVLVKPKDASMSANDVMERAARATGAPVTLARKSARTWFLVQFAPRDPPRDAAAQQKLIDALRGTGLFEKLEADRMMKGL